MVAFNKFQDFVEQVLTAKHNATASGDVFKVYLSNEAPLATDTVKADIADITAQNGYPAGGTDVQNTLSESSGTATVAGTDVVVTPRTIDVHMAALRKKMDSAGEHIETVRGVGYRFRNET